jgi:SRSO17 transposase
MAAASIETTLDLWVSSLRAVKARIRPLFKQDRVAASAGLFLDGILGDERRKTGWMRAEAAGDPGPWRQQAILGRGRWDADALRDIVRDYVVEHLAADDAVLVIDETGFLKQGHASCGVGRQYTGSAGKITNARSACSLRMSRGMATPLSTGRCTCRRPGRMNLPGWRRPMCRTARPSGPSPDWRSE